MEECVAVSLEACMRVDLSLDDPCEPLVVDLEAKRRGGADIGVESVGHGHGIVERGRVLVRGELPFGGEDEESIGGGRAARGALSELAVGELPLGGVERHHEYRYARGEELARGARI